MKKVRIVFPKNANFFTVATTLDRELSEGIIFHEYGKNIFFDEKYIYIEGILSVEENFLLDFVQSRFREKGLPEPEIRFIGIDAYLRDEPMCLCTNRKVVLISIDYITLGSPFLCMMCRRRVKTNQISFPVPDLYDWQKLFARIEEIYINSSLYAGWAKNELANIKSKLNQRAISLAMLIDKHNHEEIYYELPQELLCPRTKCPNCGATFTEIAGNRICKNCHILCRDNF